MMYNALMDAPQCARGKVEVRGLVNSVGKEKGSLVLVDLTEKDNCEDECPIRRLPVIWTGVMPKRGVSVLISGEVKKQQEKFVFAAQSLHALEGTTKQ